MGTGQNSFLLYLEPQKHVHQLCCWCRIYVNHHQVLCAQAAVRTMSTLMEYVHCTLTQQHPRRPSVHDACKTPGTVRRLADGHLKSLPKASLSIISRLHLVDLDRAKIVCDNKVIREYNRLRRLYTPHLGDIGAEDRSQSTSQHIERD